MSGSIFSRLKTWLSTEDVDGSDLNAEFDNILNNLDAEGVGSYGDNVTEFRVQTDPVIKPKPWSITTPSRKDTISK